MKIGVEEEFIIADPSTLWFSPAAFHLATDLIYSNSIYIRKCSVELPLTSGSWSTIRSRLGEAFCVFEVKTDPYEDIDDLRDELYYHRRMLCDCAKDNHLLILPCGLHPAHRNVDLIDNCAALHIHVDYSKDRFERIYGFTPFLLSLSVNSPFLDGRVHAMSTRMRLSPHVNQSIGGFERHADIIHNPKLKTVEVKVLDSQITLDETIGLVSIMKGVGENTWINTNIIRENYAKIRNQAILKGKEDINDLVDAETLDMILDYDEDTKKKILMSTGAEWQKDIYHKHGLSSVITSLAASFEQDKRVIKPCDHDVKIHTNHQGNLWYLLPYLPFFVIDKYKKYHQDIKLSGGFPFYR